MFDHRALIGAIVLVGVFIVSSPAYYIDTGLWSVRVPTANL
jgi:hypothetical protein